MFSFLGQMNGTLVSDKDQTESFYEAGQLGLSASGNSIFCSLVRDVPLCFMRGGGGSSDKAHLLR